MEALTVGAEQRPVAVVDQAAPRVERGGGRERDQGGGAHHQRRGGAAGEGDAGQPEPGTDQHEQERAAGELPRGSRPGDRHEVEPDEQNQRRDPSRDPAARRPEGDEGGEAGEQRGRQQDHQPRPPVGAGVRDGHVADPVQAAADVPAELVPVAGEEKASRQADDDHPGADDGQGGRGRECPAHATRLEPRNRRQHRPGAGREHHGKEHPASRRMGDEARPLNPGEGRERREAGQLDPAGAIQRERVHAATLRPGAARSPATG